MSFFKTPTLAPNAFLARKLVPALRSWNNVSICR